MKILIIASVVLTVTYVVYRLFLKDVTNFKYLRMYLLSSVFLTIMMPFNSFNIDINLIPEDNLMENEVVQTNATKSNATVPLHAEASQVLTEPGYSVYHTSNWQTIVAIIYFIGVGFFLVKTIIQILFLFYKILTAERVKQENYVLIYNHGFRNSFSFFHWIFINHTDQSPKDLEKIIAHEAVHADQYHSFDLILIELLSALMWFNPFVWLMRESLQLVHEYLADIGVIERGVDRLNYQKLLVNQVAEEKFITVSSSFNKSLIKNRIIMMNKEKITKRMGYKILILFPVAVALFLVVSCLNEPDNKSNSTNKEVDSQSNKNTITAVAPTKMNVLYMGVENPVSVAVSGYESSQIEIELKDDAGRIEGENGNYEIMPSRPGLLTVVVKADGEVVQETRFRVKTIPMPVVYVNRQSGGKITKEDLLKQEGVNVFLQNFDFDVSFKVISFNVSTTDDGFYTAIESESNKITEEQRQLIKSAKPGQRIIFENVEAEGPDGSIRGVSPAIFEIVE